MPVFTSDMLSLVEPGAFLVRSRAEEFDSNVFREVDRVVVTTNEGFTDYVIGSEEDRKRRQSGSEYRRRYQKENFDQLSDIIAGRRPGRTSTTETCFY